jgi:glycine/D-amino acid oxidase-like deaminating enzyme
MVRLMNRSIDILENLSRESGDRFNLNRRGYLFVTADPARIPVFEKAAKEAASLGAGEVRTHTGKPGEPTYVPAPTRGFENQPTGSDLITDQALIREHFPYLSEHTVAVVHPRRCGWFGAQQLGMHMLEQARERGTRILRSTVEGVKIDGGRVAEVHLRNESGPAVISTRTFVNAAGPFLPRVAQMIGVDLPITHELHIKVAFRDPLRAVRRDAPLLIWTDSTYLPWSEEEHEILNETDETRPLLAEFPSGVHARPEGGDDSDVVLILWTYDARPTEPVFPFEYNPFYPEIALRGLSVMIPGLAAYAGRMPKPVLDGGYYTKTRENRPLIGPLPVEGAYVIGAFSGFGLMAATASGELLSDYIAGSALPCYAPAFALERYQDPAYLELLETWDQTGQI